MERVPKHFITFITLQAKQDVMRELSAKGSAHAKGLMGPHLNSVGSSSSVYSLSEKYTLLILQFACICIRNVSM